MLGLYGKVDLWSHWKQTGWPFTWRQIVWMKELSQEHWIRVQHAYFTAKHQHHQKHVNPS